MNNNPLLLRVTFHFLYFILIHISENRQFFLNIFTRFTFISKTKIKKLLNNCYLKIKFKKNSQSNIYSKKEDQI